MVERLKTLILALLLTFGGCASAPIRSLPIVRVSPDGETCAKYKTDTGEAYAKVMLIWAQPYEWNYPVYMYHGEDTFHLNEQNTTLKLGLGDHRLEVVINDYKFKRFVRVLKCDGIKLTLAPADEVNDTL